MIESERQALKNDLFNEIPHGLALTGRVRDWGEGRLPVSCTVFHVEDSMEGDNGIEASWIFTSHALRNAAGCAIDLNSLRPSGTTNDKVLSLLVLLVLCLFTLVLMKLFVEVGFLKMGLLLFILTTITLTLWLF